MDVKDIRQLTPGTKVTRGTEPVWNGVVVFNNTVGLYSDAFPKEHWDYLGDGFMVQYDQAGLVFAKDVDDEEILP